MAIINFNSISGVSTISVASSITVGNNVSIGTDRVTATSFSGNLTGNVTGTVNSTSGVTTVATLNVGAGGTIISTTGIGSVGIGTTNPRAKLHLCAQPGYDGDLILDDVNRNAIIYAPSVSSTVGGEFYFRKGLPGSYTDRLIIDNQGNLKLGAGSTVLNSSGNPILRQTGSILQVSWKNLGSGSFTATSTSSTYRATGYTNTITPIASSSKILHIVTIGVQFICDGNLAIARGGTVASPSLMDSYRDVATTSYVNDSPAFTFTWLDSPATTSAISYELYCRATGCGGLMWVGSSSDFDASWTLMEVAA